MIRFKSNTRRPLVASRTTLLHMVKPERRKTIGICARSAPYYAAIALITSLASLQCISTLLSKYPLKTSSFFCRLLNKTPSPCMAPSLNSPTYKSRLSNRNTPEPSGIPSTNGNVATSSSSFETRSLARKHTRDERK